MSLTTVKGSVLNRGVNVKDYGAVGDGVTDDTAAIQAAIDAAGASGGGTVRLPVGSYAISSTITIGDGVPGTASTYNNVHLMGDGCAPLDGPGAATTLLWIGATNTTTVMVSINGRISGCGVSNIYINADNKAGTCLRVLSNVAGDFYQIHCSNFTSIGIDLGIQSSAPSANWYATTNSFRNLFITTSNEGCVGIKLQGRATEGSGETYSNDWHRNTFHAVVVGVPRTLNPAAQFPCALYLGYTDSNTFIECDFQLNGITADVTLDDRDALAARTTSQHSNGDIIKIRYWGNPIGGGGSNVRHEIYYSYDDSSSAVEDGDLVITPDDDPATGRFIKYRGAAVGLDAYEKNNYPLNNFFYGCALIEGPSIADISGTRGTTTNIPGGSFSGTIDPDTQMFSVFLTNHTTLDNEEIPVVNNNETRDAVNGGADESGPAKNVAGYTDKGIMFGRRPFEIRGDNEGLTFTQDNNMRRMRMYLNASSSTSGGANNYGVVLAQYERSNEHTDAYSQTGKITFTRDGGLTLNEIATAPLVLPNGTIYWNDGTTHDPLNLNTGGPTKNYLSIIDQGSHYPLVPGLYVYHLSIADDSVLTIALPESAGFIEAAVDTSGTAYVTGRVVTTPSVATFHNGAGASTLTTGVLTGTTGSDGFLNISVHSDGNLYVENRRGFVHRVTVYFRATWSGDS
jgi:hypothetical protein